MNKIIYRNPILSNTSRTASKDNLRMTSAVLEVQSVTFLNFTLHYKTKLEDIKEVLRIPYKWFLLGEPNYTIFFQIGGMFLAVLNFHDSES